MAGRHVDDHAEQNGHGPLPEGDQLDLNLHANLDEIDIRRRHAHTDDQHLVTR